MEISIKGTLSILNHISISTELINNTYITSTFDTLYINKNKFTHSTGYICII
jgi:hypothetical protein